MNEQIYAGIDVAKRHFVVGLSGRKQTKTFTHNPKGLQQAVAYLQKFADVDLIVLESTGDWKSHSPKPFIGQAFA